jgi:hypothetical protein
MEKNKSGRDKTALKTTFMHFSPLYQHSPPFQSQNVIERRKKINEIKRLWKILLYRQTAFKQIIHSKQAFRMRFESAQHSRGLKTML